MREKNIMTSKQPDWEAIERAYRAGLLSVRAIAEKYDTNEGTIRSRAKKNGWVRDLTEQVRTATKEKLSRKDSRNDVTQRDVREDAQIVEEAATEAASVVLAHRLDLAQWRSISNKLREALQDIEVTEDNIGDFSRSLNAGVDAQLKVIKGERQAYNLDTDEGSKTVNDLSDLMDELSKEA
jgi:predicted  nucleic acid-binding Zn-ribbon protein